MLVLGVTEKVAFFPNAPSATVRSIMGASEAYVAMFTTNAGRSSRALRLAPYTNRSGMSGEQRNRNIIA